ncbi:MAG: hypothetical protein QM632_00615 [Micrococcaceae bacterium]
MQQVLQNWFPDFPLIVVTIVLLYVPGLFLSMAFKFRNFAGLVVAPAFSAVTLSLLAILLHALGIAWQWWDNLVFSLVISLLVFGIRYILNRKKETEEVVPPELYTKNSIWLFVAFLSGFLYVAYFMMSGIFNPYTPALSWDSVFHINAIRYIIDSGSASPFTLNDFKSVHGFYPAVFHQLVSEIVLYSGSGIPAAYNSVTLVVSAVLWVSCMLFMLYTFFPTQKLVWVLGMIIAAGFPLYPYRLLSWGGQMPNLFGYAFIPLAIAAIYILVRKPEHIKLSEVQRYVLVIVSVVAATLTHPSALYSIAILTVALIVEYFVDIYKNAETPQAKKYALGYALFFVVAAIVVWINFSASSYWDPSLSLGPALLDSLSYNFFDDGMIPYAALVPFGLFVAIYRKEWRFIAIGYIVVLCFYLICVAAPEGKFREILTSAWYSEAARIVALLIPFAVVLICLLLNELLQRIPTDFKVPVVASLLLAALVVTNNEPMKTMMHKTFITTYEISDQQFLMNPDKYNMIQELDDYVPEDSGVIVNNPYNGGALVYGLSNRKVMFPVLGGNYINDDEKIIATQLNQASNIPEVCEALNRENATYALDFGQSYVPTPKDQHPAGPDFTGLIGLENSPGFELIHDDGIARLYKITACES